VNPQWHDEFVALCALFPSGELTEEEWALLQIHLAYCDSCRVVFDEYKQIAADVVPVLASSAASESDQQASPFSIQAAEKRLMDSLEPRDANRPSKNRRRIEWPIPGLAMAICLTVVAGLIVRHHFQSQTLRTTPATASSHAESNPRAVATADPDIELRSKLEAAQNRVAELQEQTVAAEKQYQQSNFVATSMQQQLETETTERQKISEERDALSQQLSAARAEEQSLRDKSTDANVATSQQTARLVTLETKLHDANAALDEKDRMLAVDKEFLDHDREIRDLIAARNLYIADIYDVAQNGKTSKPFGRVFYTKDKSLIFYGYDLDKQPGLKQSVAFQAWGSGDDKQDVSLGLFYQDETKKRWVLRFNDTKTLARLNMVFVTAEPQGGSQKPTGKPLLLAYLQIQPNHP
jgi:predicted  nucleic acid-binding Zn-ribbon protein